MLVLYALDPGSIAAFLMFPERQSVTPNCKPGVTPELQQIWAPNKQTNKQKKPKAKSKAGQ